MLISVLGAWVAETSDQELTPLTSVLDSNPKVAESDDKLILSRLQSFSTVSTS